MMHTKLRKLLPAVFVAAALLVPANALANATMTYSAHHYTFQGTSSADLLELGQGTSSGYFTLYANALFSYPSSCTFRSGDSTYPYGAMCPTHSLSLKLANGDDRFADVSVMSLAMRIWTGGGNDQVQTYDDADNNDYIDCGSGSSDVAYASSGDLVSSGGCESIYRH